MRKSTGLAKKALHTSKNLKTPRSEEKREKGRVASSNFRKKQNEYTQNLTDKIDALQNEEQDLRNKIKDLRMESIELRKKQQFLRGFLMDTLTDKNNTVAATIEEPFLNTQFNM